MWKHTVRTPTHPNLVPTVVPWRESFQPVHTWEPEEPNTGMFYSELCNGIPNFAFHIHTLSKGREEKGDIEALGCSSAVCKKDKGVVALLLSLCYCPESKLPHKGTMELSSRDRRQSREQRARTAAAWCSDCIPTGIQLWRNCVCLTLPDFLDFGWRYTRHCLESQLSAENPQTTREPCYRWTEWNPAAICPDIQVIFLSHLTLKKCYFYWQVSGWNVINTKPTLSIIHN